MNDVSEKKGTVLIVDDDRPVQESLALLLDAAGYATHCHDSGEDLLRSEPPEGPACLLLDLNMPGMSGIEIQHQLLQSGWNLPIVFLTGHGDVPAAVKALQSGAVDFLEKTRMAPADLLESIGGCVSEHRRRMAEREAIKDQQDRIDHLTAREFQVARLASAGMTNGVIGMELGISERTVEVHRGRAMKKLGLRCAADLARLEVVFDRVASGR